MVGIACFFCLAASCGVRSSDPATASAARATAKPVASATVGSLMSEPEPSATPEPVPTAASEPEASATPEPTIGPSQDLPASGYDGEVKAIRTASGAVVAVRGVEGSTYEVVTPCYNVASITGGLALSADLDVLIDPGHGGDEPGAVGPNGLIEADVNLQVAELLRTELLDRGFTAELTRYSDVRVAIQSRAELANALAPELFISVHHNGGFPQPFPVAGTEVFVQLDDSESQRLGGLIFEEVQIAFADTDIDWMGNLESFGVAWRKNDEGTDLYGVLRRTPGLVSVLTEAMFISTEAEAELLAQSQTLQIEAVALANAVERWFRTDDLGTGFIEGIVFEGDLGSGGGAEGCIDPPLSS